MKIFITIISFIAFSTSFIKASDTLFVHEYLNLPVYNSTKLDITGNGLLDVVNLNVTEDENGFRNFTLTVNENSLDGIHSYNVFGFMIIDLEVSNPRKEISVYTGGPNGPDEHIVYGYENGDLFEIGRIYSNAQFPGNSTVITETEMMFWLKVDTIRYRQEFEFFFYSGSDYYDLDVETVVNEGFELYSENSESAVSIGMLEEGKSVKIIKADTSPFCFDAEQDREMCDWYLFEVSTGTKGWARLRDFIYKVDLPWRI